MSQMKAQMDAIKQNPDMLKSMGKMMENMSPEQLESFSKMSGAPAGISPEMMKMAMCWNEAR